MMTTTWGALALLLIGAIVLAPVSLKVSAKLKSSGEKFVPSLFKTAIAAMLVVAVVFVIFIAVDLQYALWVPLMCLGTALGSAATATFLTFRR